MADYNFAVNPGIEHFDTRHEAVGFAAIHGRKYTYRRMNSIDTQPIPLRVEPFEVND